MFANKHFPVPALTYLVKIQVGSHLYGTATPQSDTDYKGVFLPSKESILLGRIPESYSFSSRPDGERNTSDDVDMEAYSLHYFLQLACEGQTIALDMLHAPDNMILETSAIWQAIVKERRRFYSKRLDSFVNYARKQASIYGIKGSRLQAVEDVLAVLNAVDGDAKLQAIWNELPRREHCGEAGRDPNGMRMYEVCGKRFQESVTVAYMLPVLEQFASQYGQRAKLAAQNQAIDWKAVSHALRVALQVKQILTEQTITFPLKDAAFLRQVKQGELDYLTHVAPTLDALMDEVETLLAASELPEQADTAYWDRFLCDVLEQELFAQSQRDKYSTQQTQMPQETP